MEIDMDPNRIVIHAYLDEMEKLGAGRREALLKFFRGNRQSRRLNQAEIRERLKSRIPEMRERLKDKELSTWGRAFVSKPYGEL